jgi:hypothetical protein
MKRISRLAILLGILAAIATGSFAGASTAAVAAPVGLHGFLLVASEPQTSTFNRTPSFAWKPLAGAFKYELQLSTSDTFHENGILYDASNLPTPVAAPTLTLPWITGSPHSLYARVRATFAGGRVSPWSADYGFDVVPSSVPTPLPSDPGLLRWTPVAGAEQYQVWISALEQQGNQTIVMNKFEQVNTNVLDEREYYAFHPTQQWIGSVQWRIRAVRMDLFGRNNGLPVATHGPWSPVYTSTNPDPTAGPITLGGTVSDTVSNGSPNSPSHALAPAFVWSGDEALDGTPAQFFRVYVFTDSACINRVWASATVASPAYAPRLGGPLAMPDGGNTQAAQTTFLPDGTETKDMTADFEAITPNEQLSPASSTTSLGGSTVKVSGFIGAPIDLWDLKWPSSGYYWTVIPVAWNAVAGKWQDLELAQDACAAGRVARFGISSQPSVTKNHAPFASGLSSTGKLVSATKTNTFYGEPLVAWTPAPDAWAYEVQWGKKAYPFTARGKQLTFNTSLVMPLKPGTWYYRVRGYDYNLPTGAQEMAWSAPVKVVVARPKFRIVG